MIMKKFLIILATFVSLVSFATEDFSENYFDKIKESASWLETHVQMSPELLVVVTAGVEGPEALLTDTIEISSSDIPHFPIARAEGHKGTLLFGRLDGKDVVIMKGRYHYYEGLSAQEVVFPYFVLHALGVKSVITTNAVGGVHGDFIPGDIMLITDQINSIYDSPLRGITVQTENHFFGMADAYTLAYQQIAQHEAEKLNIPIKQGVYSATIGPNYETKSEVKMLRSFGVDAVGMSTIFEVQACSYLDMKVLAFSCVANAAADLHEGEISHEEVLKVMNASGKKISDLVNACAKQILH
jgi:purine-nucleoside phosphorylase